MCTSMTVIGFSLLTSDNDVLVLALICQWFFIIIGIIYYSHLTTVLELVAWAAMIYTELYAPDYFIYPFIAQAIFVLMFW